MTLDKEVKRLVRNISIGVGLGTCFWFGVNLYQHHNVQYEFDGQKNFQKVDGIFAWTELSLNKDGSIIVNRNSLSHTSYTDYDRDGDVDRIYKGSPPFGRGPGYRILFRDKHLENYPQVFQKADQDFRQQIKRFKPYINK